MKTGNMKLIPKTLWLLALLCPFTLCLAEPAKRDVKEAANVLNKLVHIKTSKLPNYAQHNNPNIIKFGRTLEKLAKAYQLSYKNYDNYAFDISLNGTGDKSVGFYMHADTVDAITSEWQLSNHLLDPYQVKHIGNKYYGRGTIDDKGAIATALIALKSLAEKKTPLKNAIHLVITTSEETEGNGIKYYLAHHGAHDVNIGIDNEYPVQIGEDGVGKLILRFPVSKSIRHNKDLLITHYQGSFANNVIPQKAKATLLSMNPDISLNALNQLKKQFQKEHKAIQINITKDTEQKYHVTALGKATHSSLPEAGVNPVSHLNAFLYMVNKKHPMVENHFLNAITLSHELFGLDYYGRKLALNHRDKQMGPLIISPTNTQLGLHEFTYGFNIRLPKGLKAKTLKQKLKTALVTYKKNHQLNFNVTIPLVDASYQSKITKEIGYLNTAYERVRHQKATLNSHRGYTSMHVIKDGISFGPHLPGSVYMGHRPLEYITEDELRINVKILTTAFNLLGTKY